MRRPFLATIALFLLALLFGWETRQALQATPVGKDSALPAAAGAWQPGVAAPDPQPPPDATPAASAIAARPLFRPDRQPFREQGPGAARNYEAELSGYTLLGVLGFGDAPVGVVTGKAGNKGERWELKVGDLLGGFTVKEVGMEGLRLTADGREFLLPLYAGSPKAATGTLRTEVPRRDVAPPSPGFPAAAKPAVPVVQPKTVTPSASAAPARPEGFPPVAPAAAQGVVPPQAPASAPAVDIPRTMGRGRYIPGR